MRPERRPACPKRAALLGALALCLAANASATADTPAPTPTTLQSRDVPPPADPGRGGLLSVPSWAVWAVAATGVVATLAYLAWVARARSDDR